MTPTPTEGAERRSKLFVRAEDDDRASDRREGERRVVKNVKRPVWDRDVPSKRSGADRRSKP